MDLIEYCGGLVEEPACLVNGGPMMGQPLPSVDVPVVKGMSGILALAASEVNDGPETPCIRCGSCVSICPCGLVPAEMASFIRKDMLENAANLGVRDCVSCGSFSWVCPSHLPLVHYFNYAKGALNAQERDRNKLERVKNMVEAHNQRLEKAAAAAAAKRAAKTPPASQPPAKKGARAEASNDGANT
jgi:electron transport complex protein RnfC